jgi:hypothetical protein
VVDDAGVGKFTSGKFVEENVGHWLMRGKL